MKFVEILDFLIGKFLIVKDAIMGTFIVFLYALAYSKKTVLKNFADFLMGSIFAMYVAPIVHQFININLNFLAFALGMTGMKFIEFIMETPWKIYADVIIQKYIKK